MDLLDSMRHADDEEDINEVLRYFSSEHFYVIYYRFWELDMDHASFIDKENLIKYGNHVLIYRIVDRIFSEEKCAMKILFTLFCPETINLQNRDKIIG